MRENDVRFQVSFARSAAKDLGVISTAVRHTPLTAMLSPFLSSLTSSDAKTVRRRLPFSFEIPVTRPTSSMIPVNISQPQFHHRATVSQRKQARLEKQRLRFPLCLCG